MEATAEQNSDDDFQDALDDFEDAVDKPSDEQSQPVEIQPQADGSVIYADKDGYQVQRPKKWDFDTAFTYEDEDLKDIFQNASPGNAALTEQMKAVLPLEPFLGSQRILFYPLEQSGPWDLTKQEQDAITAVKEHCKARGRTVPDIDNEILRGLWAKKMNVEKTLAEIDLQQRLFANKFPFHVTKNVFELLYRGVVYICGRDRCYRPVLVVRTGVYNQMPDPKPSPDEVIAAVILNCCFARKYMMLDGRIENYSMIFDLRGKPMLAMSVIKPLVSFFPKFNNGRFRSFYVLHCPMTINIMWATIRYFLHEVTQKKVQFSSTTNVPDMHKLIHPEQLEKCFGGTAKNRKNGEYWPPSLNSTTFGENDIDISALSGDKADIRMSIISNQSTDKTEDGKTGEDDGQ